MNVLSAYFCSEFSIMCTFNEKMDSSPIYRVKQFIKKKVNNNGKRKKKKVNK